MKRTQDKIKDLVEAQAFDEVQNYASDPVRALAAYRFTDATSDLLSRWLDALSNLQIGNGASRALAGLRGVGKSHTLAAFSALAAYPAVRATVSDAHVAAGAGRLINRPYAVARVERGTRATLKEELAAAFAKTFGGAEIEWTQQPSASSMLATAASRTDTPLVVVIDTAFGHENRVRRDDGALLGELAAATREINAFIALALDDDIEGADGANVALSGAFQIDYLDPEHLYRIADVHLFQKNPQGRAALRDLYTTLRQVVPAFNWSEPRFAAIYPVHPLVADIAHSVRFYAPTFAFLPFAAAAGVRAVNRPALSLIVLDDVFDRTEYDLRKADALHEAFAAYEQLAMQGISQIPIMQRLQAKMLLKGLFILSLDGRGATARELGAAMLIFDENDPQSAINRIEDLLARFAAFAPEAISRSDDAAAPRYRFNIRALQQEAGSDNAQPAAPPPAPQAAMPQEPSARYEPATPHAPATFDEPAPSQAATPAPLPVTLPTTSPAPLAEDRTGGFMFDFTPSVAEIAPPPRTGTSQLSSEELTAWAQLLTNQTRLASIAEPEAREAARVALSRWLDEWRSERILEKFDALPDEGLVIRAWDLASAIGRSFVPAAAAIEAALASDISLEEGLQRVAHAFNNSPETFARRSRQLEELIVFINNLTACEHARVYLATAEPTAVDEIESARRELLNLSGDVQNFFNQVVINRFNLLWREFHARYTEHYAALHDQTVVHAPHRRAIAELLRSDHWRDFESLSRISFLNREWWDEAAQLIALARSARCALPVRQLLNERATCDCVFRLREAETIARLPQDLHELMQLGRAAHRRTLAYLHHHLAVSLDALARDDHAAEPLKARARSLSTSFARNLVPEQPSPVDIELIERAMQQMSEQPLVHVQLPTNDFRLLTRDEMRARLNQWLDDMPDKPALIEMIDGNEGQAI